MVVKKEFVASGLDLKNDIFVVHIAFFVISNKIHSSRKAQIASLKVNKASITLFLEYSNFIDLFSPKLAAELSEPIKMNNHVIDLIDGKWPPYKPIYSLESVELKTLKTYIKTNLANSFIRPSKSPVSTLIFLV